jgi:hypothetical protein
MDMSDLFKEKLISVQPTMKNRFIKVFFVMLTILMFFFGIMLHPAFLLAGFALILLDIWLIPRQSVEYEYSYVNGVLDIDRIFSKQTRKKGASYDLSEAEVIAPAGSDHLSDFRNVKVVDYTSGAPEDEKNAWAFVISSKQERQKVLISPTEDMLKDMRMRAPSRFFTNERAGCRTGPVTGPVRRNGTDYWRRYYI